MFKVFAKKGFQTTFENGFTVSVMFGAGNYSGNRLNEDDVFPWNTVPVWSEHNSKDAEIAVFGPDGEFRNDFPGCHLKGRVMGWITPEQMLEVMNWAASQTV